ncbi:MAG: leucine/isoleucine/valine transporter permease subunit [Anaerolineaceae bacterium]|nr:MAG: leucine/isoleucine/valine transporter permease subunit [Anaerolineaceae bacterium]
MTNKSTLKRLFSAGMINGVIVIFLGLVGMIETFSQRDIVSGLVSMGILLLFIPFIIFGYSTAKKEADHSLKTVLYAGGLSGLVAGFISALLPILGQFVNLRDMFMNASPILYATLNFGQGVYLGGLILILVAGFLGALGAGFLVIPSRIREAFLQAVIWTVLLGLMRDLLTVMIARWGAISSLFKWLFAGKGLSIPGALVIFFLVGLVSFWRSGKKQAVPVKEIPTRTQKNLRLGKLIAAVILMLFLPQILGIYFSEILDNVGIYILMGLGLNIVIGFAGLLDLGYVAFFAIGAYTVGVLTSPEMGVSQITFWQALPFALLASVTAGVILGLPVLKMRGDYLAIVTLGFGEIIRLLSLSDWLRPYLGGTQGIQRIARPMIGSLELKTQGQLYYLIVAAILIAGFIAWRLKDSHMGRSWMAMREDEDVAQAMGINLVATKLSAFATGAFFAGLAGAIFAAKLSSAYPQSMNLMVSINVLCLIIVGGMGSIPGVFVGALVLMGSPELLREFAEYRYLVYGALLVVMMLVRPEGLWPEERRKLELHESTEPDSLPKDIPPVTENPAG